MTRMKSNPDEREGGSRAEEATMDELIQLERSNTRYRYSPPLRPKSVTAH